VSSEVNFIQSSGFIGGGLTWFVGWELGSLVGILGGGAGSNYVDVQIIPSAANESLTVLGKTFTSDAAGQLRVVVEIRNNTANDTYFFANIIMAPA
jgi:hypothetical protein